MIKKINRSPTKYGEAVSVEFYSKSDALAKLGNYVGVENFAPKPTQNELDLAQQFLAYIIETLGWSRDCFWARAARERKNERI